ncbi:MAG: diacylglycerol kinase family protein [Oscillospiraceae bacterium]|nr:diacylglycerol kinase family protein [Oscillospiraceae bacterium]
MRTTQKERNFRIHLVCMIYMYAFLGIFDWFVLDKAQWAILFIANAIVLSAEIFNTAIEALVDLATRQQHPLAAIAKDCAAGAVLICAVMAVAVGVILLWQPSAFTAMYDYFRTHLWMLAAFVISLGISMTFIFGKKRNTPK